MPELVAAIDAHVARQNTQPKPFVWIESAAGILQKVICAGFWFDESGATGGCLHDGR